MIRILSGIYLFLMSFLTYAVVSEGDAGPPPSTDASPIAMIVVVVLFVAMIGGFFWFVWMKEKQRKGRGEE